MLSEAPKDPRATRKPDELRLRPNAYDNESSFWLWRALPLAEGYRTRYTSVNVFERTQTTVDLTVVRSTEVDGARRHLRDLACARRRGSRLTHRLDRG